VNWAQRLDNAKGNERICSLNPSSIPVNTTDMNISGATYGIMISNEPIDYDILNDCLGDGTNRWTQDKRGEQETIF
jgi:hypothetical protein